MNKTILILCILCFFSSCDFSDDDGDDLESSLKEIKIVNNSDKNVSIYRVREKNGVPEQKMHQVLPGYYILIKIQYKIFIDGQFTAISNGSIRVYDVDISSGNPQTITIETGDIP
ncbi:MAG: hypothetical protein KBH06_01500 [Spirochaetes bacterium]|nr:hypothetical protein [Spirochaetota bacterium]